ncbi:hypothetical protein [Flavobacterium sp.]|uniref:hypothetical protein n=1 Tax=Flavobacterium sp. TaxID=239 RepID=UPI002612A040|nr:hypothetical protein [Flavobacterium sp.]MDG2433441.1 hypothetical protein [Flavobacterium sp.]
MKLFQLIFVLYFSSFAAFSQDYFIKEDFVNNKIKFSIPFSPDWNRDFFVETEVRVANSSDPGIENAGLIFSFDKEIESFYGIYISYGANIKSEYKDFIKFRTKNVTSVENDDVWLKTALVNHEGFNRLQVYKIDDELFFAINDQVIHHIEKIESKGNELQLTSGKKGLYAHYMQAYYLDESIKSNLKENLISQLEVYQRTGIHHKIANDYEKVLTLKEPKRIASLNSNVSNYIPEIDVISVGSNDISFENNVINYDSKTMEVLSESDFKLRLKNLAIYNESLARTHINPSDLLEGKRVIGKLQGSLILVKDNEYGFYSYDLKIKKFNKLIKTKATNRNIIISDNYKYLCVYDKVFSLETGKEIEYKYTGGMPSDNPLIVACYQDNIIVRKGSQMKTINLATKEEKEFKEEGYFQNHYFFKLNGRELSILDLSTNKYIVEHLQVLAFDRKSYLNCKFNYFPESNKVYVSQDFNLNPVFYFSLNDAVQNTSSYSVDLNTNEITPFLLHKSGATIQANEEKNEAVEAQSKVEVEYFLSQFKTFGNYYELNYDNFDYVNVSSNELLNKNGIKGTTYVIGKFCTYNGGDLLAIGVTKDQYQVELITISYGIKGVFIRRKALGVTQNVNGYTTQIASVKIYRNSSDTIKYTLIVNDGKETKIQLTSDCK